MSTDATSAAISEASPDPVPKRSATEGIKEASRQLRGTIALDLVRDVDHFSEQDKQLIKFHGSYQQEDRDARKNRKKEGVGKHYMFMVRCKIPGGRLTATQYLAMDRLAEAFGNGTLRFTTRQGIQLHGVLKENLKETIAGINACLLTTLGACGDVCRNVMACPAPFGDGVHAQLQEAATTLAAHLAPRTRAYHEIWLNGQPVESNGQVPDVEPLYGKVYLPRKFKVGLALPHDNCIDVYAQDLGLLAVVEKGSIVGYNVLVGGGMGMTHGNANTFPYLAKPICYVPANAVVSAVEAVVRLFRDHGNRADRKRARIKYVVHDWGVEKFRQVLSEYVGGELQLPRQVEPTAYDPHHGWQPQGDGKWFYGLSIENGRVKDEGSLRLRTGLRTIMERLQPSVRLTPLQDILLCDLDESARPELERLLDEHGIPRPERLSEIQKYSMACPAIPTCGLAISESERALPALIDQLEETLRKLGLENEKISVRMTGCPNGCARPYQSDIGIVGRSGEKFTLFVGGNLLGTRLSFVLRDLVPVGDIVPVLTPILESFQRERQAEEGFGDYCQRLGLDRLQALLPPPAGKTTANGNGHAPALKTNGDAHPTSPINRLAPPSALTAPDTQGLPLTVDAVEVVAASLELGPAFKESETFLAGLPGEELRDFTFRYNSDGAVRETIVYFYGEDHRAGTARGVEPLRRQAAYLGRVDPLRLHSARKLHDTFFVGPPGHERRDRRVEYQAGGAAGQTFVYFYEGDVRAAVAPSGAPLRRQVVYEGDLPQ